MDPDGQMEEHFQQEQDQEQDLELKQQLCMQVVMMDQILQKHIHIMEQHGLEFLLLIQQEEV